MSDETDLLGRVLLALQDLDRSNANMAATLDAALKRITALEMAQPPKPAREDIPSADLLGALQ